MKKLLTPILTSSFIVFTALFSNAQFIDRLKVDVGLGLMQDFYADPQVASAHLKLKVL